MNATHVVSAPARPNRAVFGTFVTVLALVAAALAVLGALQVLYVMVAVEGPEQIFAMYGAATAIIGGVLAAVLSGVAKLLNGDRHLLLTALLTGLGAVTVIVVLFVATSL